MDVPRNTGGGVVKTQNVVAFRVDASLQIGSGHVMRCLTLANALREQGFTCFFVSREHQGNLNAEILRRGFEVRALPLCSTQERSAPASQTSEPAHAAWLGCEWEMDAEQTKAALGGAKPDWLVVDHYALDQRWERRLRERSPRIMVIDDLADRIHDCDVLLDQNLGRKAGDYDDLVPESCKRLIGPRYALLRPEFAALRGYSLRRRKKPALQNLLITMGGIDQPNATGVVLDALKDCPLPLDCRISVVLGKHAPWRAKVERQAANMPWVTEVAVAVDDMAQRMMQSDLVIGAAGSTAWERCVLGVPTLLLVLAPNQAQGARALHEAGAACSLGTVHDVEGTLRPVIQVLVQSDTLRRMAMVAAEICDGYGAYRVVDVMRLPLYE